VSKRRVPLDGPAAGVGVLEDEEALEDMISSIIDVGRRGIKCWMRQTVGMRGPEGQVEDKDKNGIEKRKRKDKESRDMNEEGIGWLSGLLKTDKKLSQTGLSFLAQVQRSTLTQNRLWTPEHSN